MSCGASIRLRLSVGWCALKWFFVGDEISFGRVTAVGSRDFVKRATSALGLLHSHAPVAYAVILQDVGTVIQWHSSSVWLRDGRSWALVPSNFHDDVNRLAVHFAGLASMAKMLREERAHGSLSPAREAELEAESVDFIAHVMAQLSERDPDDRAERDQAPLHPN